MPTVPRFVPAIGRRNAGVTGNRFRASGRAGRPGADRS